MWPKTRMAELTTKATQTKAFAKLQNTRHEQSGNCLSVSATLCRQPHLLLYCTVTEIEEDIHTHVGRARQLQGDNAWMSSSPSKSRNERFERERKDGPFDHCERTRARGRNRWRSEEIRFASKNGRHNPERRLPRGRSCSNTFKSHVSNPSCLLLLGNLRLSRQAFFRFGVARVRRVRCVSRAEGGWPRAFRSWHIDANPDHQRSLSQHVAIPRIMFRGSPLSTNSVQS